MSDKKTHNRTNALRRIFRKERNRRPSGDDAPERKPRPVNKRARRRKYACREPIDMNRHL